MERQPNMAAVAAREASVEGPTKTPKGQVLKSQAPKTLKTSKARGKPTAAKSAGPKVSEAKSPAISSIPLLCVVCPANPHFSDVSHLLTHLNSKGHLQTFNDVRIRAIADLSAAHAISTYERWYNEHGLEAMLAERLKVKDERSKGATTDKRPGQPASQNLKKKKNLPLLVKREPGSDASWTPPPTGGLFEQQAITFYGDQNNSLASTPTDDVIDWTPDELESARLKGIVWPGMGIFDAATPDQKKKRNQRKDASVLQQMELSSQAITTTELVTNLDMEIARTRDVYDAPSVEGTPIAKSKRRQKRSRNVVEKDEVPQLLVKSEPAEKSGPQAPRTATVRHKKHAAKKESAPDMDNENLSEKLDVTSDAASLADVDIELDEDFDDSPFGTGSSLNDLNPSHLANHEELDGLRDVSCGLATPQQFSQEMMDEARFDVRNRIPLRSMNANSNLSLTSPTPSAKQLTHRIFRGKENNHGLQGQRMTGDTYVFGGSNNHVNRARMANSNSQMNQLSVADSNTTANPFHGYQQQHEIFYQQPSWGYPVVAPTVNSRFMPINGNVTQPVYFTHQFAFNTGENDLGNGANVFGDDI
ncbi:hypothetical protein CSUB01_05318 [Colletotrichum sublineola]|uniref:Uncharacterized protein n=1 Tax=Colletotrichum sublineola TaxID=1173701 RepID=A0A066X353_COLSU|nr:hypothetical protein CSUB01_05318 [Colletotrichum sublineola]